MTLTDHLQCIAVHLKQTLESAVAQLDVTASFQCSVNLRGKLKRRGAAIPQPVLRLYCVCTMEYVYSLLHSKPSDIPEIADVRQELTSRVPVYNVCFDLSSMPSTWAYRQLCGPKEFRLTKVMHSMAR